MLPLTSAAPTTAERIRSACARAGGALLAVEREDPVATPVHHLLHDGSFAVAVPADRSDEAGCGVCRIAGAAGADRLRAAAAAGTRPFAGVGPRPPAPGPARARSHRLLDLIATEYPNPALLQVETPRSVPPTPGESPVHTAAAGDRIRRW